jgi:two-component system chemotaxis sensor kinase CheA
MGKPRMGTIKVQLVKLEHRLAIHIHDDGAGIDFAKIKEVALKDKSLNSERVNELADSGQVWRILFMPGFSTKALDTTDTSLSGMGVGLDVVNTAVDELGGTVSVSSELAKGAQFTIEIPLAQGTSSPDSQ